MKNLVLTPNQGKIFFLHYLFETACFKWEYRKKGGGGGGGEGVSWRCVHGQGDGGGGGEDHHVYIHSC